MVKPQVALYYRCLVMETKMKINEVLSIIGEEAVGGEELAGKDDLKRFLLTIKKMVLSKGFNEEQASSIVNEFLNDVNSTGWLQKIMVNDNTKQDVQVSVEGSNVNFTLFSDDGTAMKTFVVKGVKDNMPQGTGQPVKPVAGKATTDTFQRYGNIKAKAGQ